MRTYTVQLLVINQQLAAIQEPGVATTPNIWPLNLPFLTGAREGKLFVEEKAILRDAEGAYLWQITNVTKEKRTPSDHIVEVRKLRITPGDFKVPYLGVWGFQEVQVDDENFDPRVNLVVGELLPAEGSAEEWNGTRVYVDSGSRWLLRPGDLVKVDLSRADQSQGYYVPLSAIARQGNQTAIFVVEEAQGNSIARRVPVRMVTPAAGEATSSLCQIEAAGGDSLEGLRCITEGAHYLIDGEPVRPISQSEGVE